MLEEIQALLPLLENVTNGALWAFTIYMGAKFFGPIAIISALSWAFLRGLGMLVPIWRGSDSENRIIDLYRLEYMGERLRPCYLGDVQTLEKFLSRCSNGDNRSSLKDYVHSSDLEAIMNGTHPNFPAAAKDT